jgi:hypothetical protein
VPSIQSPSPLPLLQKRGKGSSMLGLGTSPASQAVSNPHHKHSRGHDLSALKATADFPGSAVGKGVGGEGGRDERQLSISHLNEMLHPLDGRSVCPFLVFLLVESLLSVACRAVQKRLMWGLSLAVVCCLLLVPLCAEPDFEISMLFRNAPCAMCVLSNAYIKRKVLSQLSKCVKSYRL